MSCRTASKPLRHVEAVIAVADSRVERGQLVGMGDHAVGDGGTSRRLSSIPRAKLVLAHCSSSFRASIMSRPVRRSVEEQRTDERDADIVADG